MFEAQNHCEKLITQVFTTCREVIMSSLTGGGIAMNVVEIEQTPIEERVAELEAKVRAMTPLLSFLMKQVCYRIDMCSDHVATEAKPVSHFETQLARWKETRAAYDFVYDPSTSLEDAAKRTWECMVALGLTSHHHTKWEEMLPGANNIRSVHKSTICAKNYCWAATTGFISAHNGWNEKQSIEFKNYIEKKIQECEFRIALAPCLDLIETDTRKEEERRRADEDRRQKEAERLKLEAKIAELQTKLKTL